ncbi:unnamed protein product, partial [Amoebophrya sp. A25]
VQDIGRRIFAHAADGALDFTSKIGDALAGFWEKSLASVVQCMVTGVTQIFKAIAFEHVFHFVTNAVSDMATSLVHAVFPAGASDVVSDVLEGVAKAVSLDAW